MKMIYADFALEFRATSAETSGHSGIVAEEPALIVTDIGGIMALVKRSRMVDNTGNVPVYTV